VIFLQRTFTSLVHAHAGRTQGFSSRTRNSLLGSTSFHILASYYSPLKTALSAFSYAECTKDSEYWKSASVDEVAEANKKISDSIVAAKKLIDSEKPDYNSASSHIATAKSLCYAMSCKANKGGTGNGVNGCLAAFEVSGMLEYLKTDGVPTLKEINKTYKK